ncbi:MAG: hypothetical protein SGJ19_19905 [Planctomycetia bacterium]|nr:hypothetical protein [Planctomycetia bacterium]
MVTKFRNQYSVLFGTGMCIFSGCLGSPAPPPMPSFDPAGSAAAALEQYDANQDGKLDAGDLAKCPALAISLAELDTNGDKALDTGEIAARIQSYAEGGVARKMFTAQLLLDGRPLDAAEVKFIPEKFMLGAVVEGTGTSNDSGGVTMTSPGADPPGIGVGFYRVEVSKKDTSGKETVPAKFNTESSVGIEVPAFTTNRSLSTPVISLKR